MRSTHPWLCIKPTVHQGFLSNYGIYMVRSTFRTARKPRYLAYPIHIFSETTFSIISSSCDIVRKICVKVIHYNKFPRYLCIKILNSFDFGLPKVQGKFSKMRFFLDRHKISCIRYRKVRSTHPWLCIKPTVHQGLL